MTTLSDTKVREIAAGTEGAQAGPWVAFHDEPSQRHYGKGVWTVNERGNPSGFVCAANKATHAHIANCDPDTIKELCRLALIGIEAERAAHPPARDAEVERLREALTEAEAVMSIVEPRNTKTKYLAALEAVRRALSTERGKD